jgi:hypothetical protein
MVATMENIDSNTAKVTSYVFSITALVILIIRLAATRHRDKKFDIASVFAALSILVLTVRLAIVPFLLHYGTSQDHFYKDASAALSAEEQSNLRIGGILTLMARFLITTFYWLQICLLLLFYSSMVRDVHWVNTIKACWLTIAITWIVVVLLTFLECRPFSLYWQVEPHPGKCVRAYAQLLAQGVCNIILDLFVLAISWPLVAIKNRTLSQNLRVGTLFVLGFFCIIVTCLRVAYVFSQDSYQPVRSFWASVQILVSAFVANVPTIYGCFQLNRRRKSEQRLRRASRPDDLWTALDSPVPSNSEAPPLPIVPQRTRTSNATVRFEDIRYDDDEKVWARHIP